jgi:hypothetical protein
MKERSVRHVHRRLGITVGWFLLVQAGAGLLLTLGMLTLSTGSKWYHVVATIHTGWEPMGNVYRVILALATVTQVALGVTIFYMTKSRGGKKRR